MIPNEKRIGLRWFRYGMRTFLIVVTALSVALGMYVSRVREQRAAVAAINAWGGRVRFGYQADDRERAERAEQILRAAQGRAPTPMFVDAQPPGPRWLRRLVGDDFFTNVVVVESQTLGRVDLRPLARLKNLKRLSFFGANIVDDDLQNLRQLSNLEVLHLSATKVTDRGIPFLLALPKLRILSLNYTAVTDEGVSQLCNCRTLESLELNETNVSDSSLTNLRRMDGLTSLGIRNTKVTELALEEFHRAKPECDIVR